jgi:hypothetical protein
MLIPLATPAMFRTMDMEQVYDDKFGVFLFWGWLIWLRAVKEHRFGVANPGGVHRRRYRRSKDEARFPGRVLIWAGLTFRPLLGLCAYAHQAYTVESGLSGGVWRRTSESDDACVLGLKMEPQLEVGSDNSSPPARLNEFV